MRHVYHAALLCTMSPLQLVISKDAAFTVSQATEGKSLQPLSLDILV